LFPEQALRLMQAFASGGQRGRRQQDDQNAIVPVAEANEDENAYLLTLEIPGVDPRDVDVSVAGNTLTIKAERRRHGQQQDDQGGQQREGQQTQQGQQRARHLLFSEIQHGAIRREFSLPEDADRNRITADFRNGLLNLTVPKSQETHQRRKIEIKTS
jgi:HSP20 family protein